MGVIRYGRTAQIGVYPGNQSGRYISYRSGGKKFPLDPDTQVAWRFAQDKSLTDVILGLTLDFVRASNGTYYDAGGNLQVASVNEPRFDHDPDTRDPLGLLVEASRTNLFLNSLAPVTQSIAVANGTVYTVSMRGAGSVTLGDAGTGTVTQGNPVTFTAGSTNLDCTVSGGADWVQVEAGPTATSVIVTSGTSATRAADDASTTDLAWYGSGPGTWYMRFLSKSPGAYTIFYLGDGTNSNRVQAGIDPGQGIDFYHYTPVGDNGLVNGAGDFTLGQKVKAATAYDTNDMVGYVDGLQNGADNLVTVPTSAPFNRLNVGANNNQSNYLNGHILEFGYANVRKDNQFLQDLTGSVLGSGSP